MSKRVEVFVKLAHYLQYGELPPRDSEDLLNTYLAELGIAIAMSPEDQEPLREIVDDFSVAYLSIPYIIKRLSVNASGRFEVEVGPSDNPTRTKIFTSFFFPTAMSDALKWAKTDSVFSVGGSIEALGIPHEQYGWEREDKEVIIPWVEQAHTHTWRHRYVALTPNSTGHDDRWSGMICSCGQTLSHDSVVDIVNGLDGIVEDSD